ncbi:recombinase RecT [Lacticaseibacillus paracasei]|uniref:recombinase RecT n=1 Tax=Lacticaseibacillus paracasei TaxID=1597 RepID=UPI00156D540A|nr:recombinase RecT [Lacticaseibacillus paracasei]QKK92789.1 recombinase RecT [Lacticaseibacillus paracasei]
MATTDLQKQLNQVSQAQHKSTPVAVIKNLLKGEATKDRFNEVLGAKAPQFMSSIINIVNSNRQLQNVDAMSVISSAMVAATLDLPIDPNLGYMWLVPYKGQAQPQMGYKGYIQLALRTGQYRSINAERVYEGEIKNWDRFTETYERGDRESDKVVGYLGHFQLVNGFEKTVYWTMEQMEAHRRAFSKNSSGVKPSGVWASHYDAMAIKTVLRNMLSKWGILSIQMQDAVSKDEKPQVFDEDTGELSTDPKWASNATEDEDPDSVDPETAKKAEDFFNGDDSVDK